MANSCMFLKKNVSSPKGISLLVRMYECVKDLGLFLFNDVVVLTEKRETHVPFSLAVKTSHTFLTSVSLHSLSVSDIVDTKCKYCT